MAYCIIKKGDNMDGILLVNKPKDFTSHDVVNVLRRVFNTKKIGHTGTLDPDATGLLVIGINKGTKIMKYLNNDEKIYEAVILIGKTTDTLDDAGEIISSLSVKDEIKNTEDVINSFKGIYTQTPPMYSAIKYKGKRLYEYARKGIIIDDIPSRDITIYDIHQTGEISYQEDTAKLSYYVHSSKGLYVRTLSYDIGKKLGYPAYNLELHRIKAGNFDVKDSYTLDEIKEGNYKLLSLSESLSQYGSIIIKEELHHQIFNGMEVSLEHFNSNDTVKIVDKNNVLIAIYEKHPDKEVMRAVNIYKTWSDYFGNN